MTVTGRQQRGGRGAEVGRGPRLISARPPGLRGPDSGWARNLGKGRSDFGVPPPWCGGCLVRTFAWPFLRAGRLLCWPARSG